MVSTTQQSSAKPAPDSTTKAVQELTGLVSKAGPEAKQALRQALGVGGVIEKKKSQSNADAKRIAYSVGEAVMQEGFLPKPSEHIAQQGPEAVANFHRQWLDRQQNPSSAAEEAAAVAQM